MLCLFLASAVDLTKIHIVINADFALCPHTAIDVRPSKSEPTISKLRPSSSLNSFDTSECKQLACVCLNHILRTASTDTISELDLVLLEQDLQAMSTEDVLTEVITIEGLRSLYSSCFS